MIATVTLIALFLSAYLAFLCFALSQKRHWEAIGGERFRPAVQLRSAGGFLLLLSGLFALVRDGADYGSLLWVTTLSIAAAGVVITLTILSTQSQKARQGHKPPQEANHE
ncbi:MAG: DUF3325 family protein [Pseudolabrys sp.]